VRLTKLVFSLVILVTILLSSPRGQCFDVMDRRISYEDSKYVTLGAGLGFTGFSLQEGISGDKGFGFRVSAGHHFNRYLQAEIVYQFSTFTFRSPDPIAPNSSLHTRAAMNQELLRFILSYPTVLAQPYISLGIGGYDLIGVNGETALSFPIDFEFPISAGIRAYIYKNLTSVDFDFTYHILFGENQPQDTLSLLDLNKISFNTYSFMISFSFHLF